MTSNKALRYSVLNPIISFLHFLGCFSAVAIGSKLLARICSNRDNLSVSLSVCLSLSLSPSLSLSNGVCKGDLQGCYTYISESGSSVNDYFILSNDLYALIHSTGRIESDHMPLTFRVIFPKENVCSDEVSQHEQIIEKFVWDNLNAPTFKV